VINNVHNLPWMVVHHNSEESLKESIASLLSQGLNPKLGLIVDNSENQDVRGRLDSRYPQIKRIYIANHGYANAVNTGFDEVSQFNQNYQYVLVATHDVKLSKNCVSILLAEISHDKSLGAVGPLLFGGSFDSNQIWSGGGELYSRFKIARHLLAKESLVSAEPLKSIEYCDWLDGCLCIYNLDAVRTLRMNEQFFLYFEETDFHQKIRSQGFRLANVREAKSFQSTNGIPSFWFGRNLLLFNFLNLKSPHSLISSASQLIVYVLRLAKKRKLGEGLPSLFRGIVEGRKIVAKAKRQRNDD